MGDLGKIRTSRGREVDVASLLEEARKNARLVNWELTGAAELQAYEPDSWAYRASLKTIDATWTFLVLRSGRLVDGTFVRVSVGDGPVVSRWTPDLAKEVYELARVYVMRGLEGTSESRDPGLGLGAR